MEIPFSFSDNFKQVEIATSDECPVCKSYLAEKFTQKYRSNNESDLLGGPSWSQPVLDFDETVCRGCRIRFDYEETVDSQLKNTALYEMLARQQVYKLTEDWSDGNGQEFSAGQEFYAVPTLGTIHQSGSDISSNEQELQVSLSPREGEKTFTIPLEILEEVKVEA